MSETPAPLEPFEIRAERVLACTFMGIHHAPKIHFDKRLKCWTVNHYGELSTFDFDGLTRLVVAAHMNCIRATVCASGPGMVKIKLHERTTVEGGSIYDRHPTIESAVEQIKSYGQYGPGEKT